MADTLFFKRTQSRYPYSVNIPPVVPRYPVSQEMFRRGVPEQFTAKVGRESYQHWSDKWYDNGDPWIRRQEELPKVADRGEACQRPWQYRLGTSAIPKWSREGKDWPVDDKKFMRSGRPVTETQRARGMSRVHDRDHNTYPFSNYMTSTYRRPVYSIYGPSLQRSQVYGVTHQHNRHGNMPFEDYY